DPHVPPGAAAPSGVAARGVYPAYIRRGGAGRVEPRTRSDDIGRADADWPRRRGMPRRGGTLQLLRHMCGYGRARVRGPVNSVTESRAAAATDISRGTVPVLRG